MLVIIKLPFEHHAVVRITAERLLSRVSPASILNLCMSV